MSRAFALPAAVLVLVLALAGCGGGGGDSSSSSSQAKYVKGNTSFLQGLPSYPKAQLKKQATVGYTTGKNAVAGYQTRYTYALPGDATVPKVEAYYLKSLQPPDWKQVASLTGPVLNYRKGNAFVSLDLTHVPKHQLVVVVDKGFYSHLPTG
jgi:hypothetical protein